ncbi:hypothetical protein H5407_05540 [Mitsuaria sp. WAJ17]|uniref:hypothetical protein n=1 Tax=Mitsuaria sp. WAJ17 TaxID=2761452 RepID=UPI0015FF70D4|nr:hypothetical protein [Mitsuaria sp. WAJ17]MBB2484685.1 hypothetical protein [Mitsuaria sp. WAJ17]
MTKLNEEIKKAEQDNVPAVQPSVEQLTEIVEAELEVLSGGIALDVEAEGCGGYSRYEAKHSKSPA